MPAFLPPDHIAARWARLGMREDYPVQTMLAARLQERLLDLQGNGQGNGQGLPDGPLLVLHGAAPAALQHKSRPVVQRGGVLSAADVPEGAYAVAALHGVLPWVADVPLLLHRVVQQVQPDGVLLGWALGTESFAELALAWGALDGGRYARVGPFPTLNDVGAQLQKLGLALPVVDRDVVTLTFPSFQALVRGIRQEGGGLWRPDGCPHLTTPRQWRALEAVYRAQNPRADGRWPVTLEVLWLHAVRPGASTPKAAKRGSGTVRLVRILGDA
jgi:hypothetical protein